MENGIIDIIMDMKYDDNYNGLLVAKSFMRIERLRPRVGLHTKQRLDLVDMKVHGVSSKCVSRPEEISGNSNEIANRIFNVIFVLFGHFSVSILVLS